MSASAQSDAVLAAQGQNGSRSAFDELVSRHKAQIFRIARHYVANSDDALDILQDTFVAAWLGLKRYDTGRDFGAWLRTIALNKCRDFGRRQTVRRTVMRLFARLDTSQTSVPAPDIIAEHAQTREGRLRALDVAIATLPAAHKEVLILTAFAGLSQQQAADQLGITTKAVEMKVRRAKQRLEEILRESGWDT